MVTHETVIDGPSTTLRPWNLKTAVSLRICIKSVSVHARPEEFKNATITHHFGFSLEETWSGFSHDYRDAIVFERLHFKNYFRRHENETLAFSNSSGLKSVFEKLLFRVTD